MSSSRPERSTSGVYLIAAIGLSLVGYAGLIAGLVTLESNGTWAVVVGSVLLLGALVFYALATLRLVDLFEEHIFNGERTADAVEALLDADENASTPSAPRYRTMP
ncbi:hypothetical protein [Isoptericola dokdonensis]|uniref:YiaA/B two helix domain protein n=1 Tax=Isoptericola dokdonensis DS-3 TaxID=1300344 RepID=A0A168F3F6_9MICO|nr:hypothetical protein [Isoptericola dokdonensis]ANC30847.1 hypothetical protein I598_1287 [Isoptericola dokdonensis DS-3]